MVAVLFAIFLVILICALVIWGAGIITLRYLLSIILWALIIYWIICLIIACSGLGSGGWRREGSLYKPKHSRQFYSSSSEVLTARADVNTCRSNSKVLQVSLDGNEVVDFCSPTPPTMPFIPNPQGYSERFNVVLPCYERDSEADSVDILEWESVNKTVVKIKYIPRFGNVFVTVKPTPGVAFKGTLGFRSIYAAEIKDVTLC